MPRFLDTRDADFAAQFEALVSARREAPEDVRDSVRAIVEDVRARKDAALVELTRRFDKWNVGFDSLRVSENEVREAEARCPKTVREAIDEAAIRIEAYHTRQLPQDLRYTDEAGASLGWRWTPLASVGLYVPGGTAAYPSTVLMNALPAKVAGVQRIAMTTPASGGKIAPAVLAAARRAGVDEIYRVGGAQAVAALAFGTEAIAPVDKIVGPGNQWVAEAKRLVFGQVGIDSIAGPSEVLVVADNTSDPSWIAVDLLAQAEHDKSAQAILLTNDPTFARLVEKEIARLLESLPRKDIAEASWRDHGAIIVVGSIDEAPRLIDRVAPEHLELALADAEGLAERVQHAGAIFLGPHTPEAIGDYIAGPSHVLPTSRTARFSSGLSVLDFMKRTSLVSLSPDALAALGSDAIVLAEEEGLDAHARSIALRTNRTPKRK